MFSADHDGDPGLVLTPVVLGPDRVPMITDTEVARRRPEAAVLSAMIYGRADDPIKVFEALRAALEVFDRYHADLYTDTVLAVLPESARDILEAIVFTRPYRYQSDFARRHFDQGEVKGKAQALLTILEMRGVQVPDDARVSNCQDLWIGGCLGGLQSADENEVRATSGADKLRR